MDTTNNGQNWSAPINGSTVRSGLIGSVTNHDIVITLKNSQTLSSLGYSNNKPVYLTHTWTTNDGAIAERVYKSPLSHQRLIVKHQIQFKIRFYSW